MTKPSTKPPKGNYAFSDPSKVAERIKSKLDIVDVMEAAGVEFESKNERTAKAVCFGHQENTPSLHVSRDKQLFNCFGAGCEVGGDLVAFWMQFHKVDFSEACTALIDAYDVSVEDLLRRKLPDEIERERLIDINGRVASAFRLQAKRSVAFKKWAESRGVDDDAVLDRFRIGYSPGIQAATAVISQLRLADKDIQTLQLDSKELFNNRVIYPLMSTTGDVLAFYGRAMAQDRVKYMGMRSEHKETGVVHPLLTPDVPYGFYQAREYVTKERSLIMVEGMNDVLVAHVHGLGNVAGMRGAMPPPRMYELLKAHHVNDVTVCPDGDDAGFRTVDSISRNRARHQTVKIMTLPDGLDPDEFIIDHGVDAFRARLQDAVYPVEIVIRHAAKKLTDDDSMTNRLDVTRELAEHVNVLSGFEREFTLQELATVTHVDRARLEDLIASSGGAEFSDLHLESRIVAECFGDRGKAIHGLSILRQEDFVGMRHVAWWKLLRQMVADDIETFSREMFITYAVDKGVLHEEDVEVVPRESLGTVSLDYACKKIAEMAQRRRLNKTGSDFVTALQNPRKPVEDALSDHMRAVSTAVVAEKSVSTAADHIIQAMDVIHERMQNPGIPGLNLGPKWKRLMSQIMGFQPGHMLSVAAISKAGKTCIAQNWCLEQLRVCGEPTLWVNLEMSDLDLTLRNLSIMTGIPNQRLKIGNISKEEKASLEEASGAYHGYPLHVASLAGANVFDVINAIRKAVYSNGVKVIFVDYIQLIQAATRNDRASLWEAQNEVVAAIRQAISTLRVTGIVISQLNRGAMAESSASGQFVSGTIKLIQDSDVFMGLKRKSKEELAENPHSNASLVVEFNRHGPQETIIDLDFRPECLQIEEV